MIRRSGAAAALSAAAIAILAAACSAPGSSSGGSGGSGSGGSTGAASGPIKIAVVDAQSGSSSDLGQFEWRGVKLAVDQVNKAGGIDGRKIQLTLFDDQGDPTVGTELARKIASEGFTAMLGTAESSVTLAMAPILQAEHIPNITSGQSTKLLKLGSPYLFLNGPTGLTYDSTLAKYLVQTKGYKKFALLTNNDSYGAGEDSAFTSSLKSLGITPVAAEVVPADQTNMTPQLNTIRSRNPQVLFIGAEEAQSGLTVKQARSLGMTAVIAEGAPAGTPLFLSTAGVANADGTIVSSPYLGNGVDAASKAFAAAYTAAYGTAPELHGAKAYDGAEVMISALKACHACTGLALASAVRAVHRTGLLGTFAYDSQGVGIFSTSIGIIKNGTIEPVSS
ncbi:MAG: ABC transporter substrate-binding protein [Streptosporangiaceae bacterium]|nr:ABC transporter substrate-binding protein [Streptosporangiaceae bacterium]MBV9855340.1 ABC transporter substrate-binding protein [Streptosporangiaceae bacterium]